MNLVEYAKSELARIEHDGEGMQDYMDECVLKMIEMFSRQGHSGFTAHYAIGELERLLRWLPLTPLTGEDDEWNDLGEGTYQNKRCSKVFKKNGDAYDIEGKIFSEDGGETWFANGNSRVPVTFPYMPPTTPEKVLLTKSEKEATAWIRAEEELPLEDTDVIVTDGRSVWIDQIYMEDYTDEGEAMYLWDSGRDWLGTAWMPLPELPEWKKEGQHEQHR